MTNGADPAEPYKLSELADAGVGAIADTIALGEHEIKKEIALGEHGMKKALVAKITLLFVLTNLFVLCVAGALLGLDYVIVLENPNASRVVDKEVLQWLIGATVIQTGMIMAGIATSFFPRTGSTR